MTKILVIENNKPNMDLITYLFKHFGYESICASDGEEGIQKAKECLPDLIISEIDLPKINGYQLAKVLKNDPELKKIPLIAVTAYAMAGDRNKIRSAGFDAYIPKPINPNQFIIQIEDVLPLHLQQSHSLDLHPGIDFPLVDASTKKIGNALVVTPHEGTLQLFRKLLEFMGFDVAATTSAHLAMQEIHKLKPDIILSNYSMSETNGLKFYRMLKEIPEYQAIPFILFDSRKLSDEELREISKSSIKRFILLPIEADIFIDLVSNIYDKASGELTR